ncbi:LLM class flavin-dependent oxidoreductase, partial [Cellulomonas sp. GbtcB1]|uniref:LLM class flavin-dependent oxidoreductase n=1 Tax=Cellulomonas sp. GbtcB1 TaxID=2824746 RepID=UPI001C3027B2
TTLPRPYAGPFRIWHGSATSRFAVELAARWGDPVVTANALQPRENYAVLLDHYRVQYAAHGHDPARAYVGSGSCGL